MVRVMPLLAIAAALGGCSSVPEEPLGPLVKENLFVVTSGNRLIGFNAGQPQKILSARPLAGLQPQERVLGIDYRVARGQMFALGSSGRLYRVDTGSASATPVGSPLAAALRGRAFGFDFNPTVDRIRVVGDTGQNLRLHPETGAVVDSNPQAEGLQVDGTLAFDASDVNAGKPVAVVSAGYTYNQEDEKVTTNYAIDARGGLLLTQGTREGVVPAVSPNTGRLFTVGPLKAGPFERASFDISDVNNAAYAAFTQAGARSSVLYRIDLATGAATRIATIGGGEPVSALAIEP